MTDASVQYMSSRIVLNYQIIAVKMNIKVLFPTELM